MLKAPIHSGWQSSQLINHLANVVSATIDWKKAMWIGYNNSAFVFIKVGTDVGNEWLWTSVNSNETYSFLPFPSK